MSAASHKAGGEYFSMGVVSMWAILEIVLCSRSGVSDLYVG